MTNYSGPPAQREVGDPGSSAPQASSLSAPSQSAPEDAWCRARSALSPTTAGGVYVLILMVMVFSIWLPKTFPHVATIWQILNSNAVPAMAALTLVVPLSAGVFDISVPNTMSLSGVICAYSIVDAKLPVSVAIVLGILAAIGVGIINAVIVVFGKIDSLIGTLASGFLIQAIVLWRTNNTSITGGKLTSSFQRIAYAVPFGRMTAPVVYALVVAAVLWYLLAQTATGRRMYATGFNRDAARLASVHTARIQFASLVFSAFLAGVTGIVIAAGLGAGQPTAGNSYLLPAFAGVFVGATQLRPGRFNAWGTVLAVILLGTLTTGLSLGSVPQWGQQFGDGVVLVGALILAGRERRGIGKEGGLGPNGSLWRTWRRTKDDESVAQPSTLS